MTYISAQRHVPSRLRPGKHPIRIALVLGNVRLHPLHNHAHGFGRIIPSLPRMALHIHSRHAIFDCPQHDVVVENITVFPALNLVAGSARNIYQNGPRGAAFFSNCNVEHVFRIGSEGNIARERDAFIGRIGMQRPVDLGRLRDANSAPDFDELLSDFRRHLRLRQPSQDNWNQQEREL